MPAHAGHCNQLEGLFPWRTKNRVKKRIALIRSSNERAGTTTGSIFGLVFPHKDDRGFTILLQAFPLDGKIVCREITEGEEPTENVTPLRSQRPDRQSGTGRGKR